MSDGPKRPDTRLAHAGRRREWLQGMVNVPVSRTSTVLFDDVASMKAAYPPRDNELSYGRNGTPTHWSLIEALNALEPGAAGTRLFPSGAAAVAMALLSVLESGDELLMVDSVYQPTRNFCEGALKRFGIATLYYDPNASAAEVEALFGPKTRAIFMESPGSLTFEVQDVPGICAGAKCRGLATLLDNTWATPLLFPAIANGVDLAVLACTKYVSGHSDVMLGSVTASPAAFEALARTYALYGQSVSPDDAFLASRGLRTMGIRLKRHEENGLKVAQWLSGRAEVDRILHPALASSPGHEIWKRDFAGSSGLFAMVLAEGIDGTAFVDALRLFGIGYSWGGFESLALPVRPHRTAGKPLAPSLVRLHIGLEDPEDLIADLDRAFASLR
jgi:cystathionine beta-lyase